jgi:hypothetical protein
MSAGWDIIGPILRDHRRTTAVQKVTHGRHCPCSACAREDWTRITGPCGMHGKDCPAVYAPSGGRSESETA